MHGVYKPGNVKLTPTILRDSQDYVSKKFNLPHNSLNFVFHGGSGSTDAEIKESVGYGVIKMNIDTDTNGRPGTASCSTTKRTKLTCRASWATRKAPISRTRNTTIHAYGCAQRRPAW